MPDMVSPKTAGPNAEKQSANGVGTSLLLRRNHRIRRVSFPTLVTHATEPMTHSHLALGDSPGSHLATCQLQIKQFCKNLSSGHS